MIAEMTSSEWTSSKLRLVCIGSYGNSNGPRIILSSARYLRLSLFISRIYHAPALHLRFSAGIACGNQESLQNRETWGLY
jgi:hypothetical protein